MEGLWSVTGAGQTTSAPRSESHQFANSQCQRKSIQKKGKLVAVFVQPFLPSSNAQGLPELEVASLHLIALLVFIPFPSPCLSPGKEFLSLNTCWVKKCLPLRWAFRTFSLIAIEGCCSHRTKYIPQDLVPEMLLYSESSPYLPQNDAQSSAASWISLRYPQLCLLQAFVLSLIYSFHLKMQRFH